MTEVQTCLACQDTEDRCNANLAAKDRELENLRWTIQQMDQELQLAHQDRDMFEDKFIKAERKLYRLEHKDEEPQGKRKQKEADEIKEWLTEWNGRRMEIPGARKLNPKTLGPEGSYAVAVRSARRVWSHEDLMKCLKGAGISEWHTAELGRFKVSVLIAGDPVKRDDKIKAHIERWERYERLIDAKFPEEFARREAQHAPKPLLGFEKPAARCPECGRDTEREGCFCRRKWMEAAA